MLGLGLHSEFALDEKYREMLEVSDREGLELPSTMEYEKNLGTYCEQIRLMLVGNVHSITLDELMIAVSRLFLGNIEDLQSLWVKFGDAKGLNCGANGFMGTILSEKITKRVGSGYSGIRSLTDYVEGITAVGRTSVECSTDREQRRRFDPNGLSFGIVLRPCADDPFTL